MERNRMTIVDGMIHFNRIQNYINVPNYVYVKCKKHKSLICVLRIVITWLIIQLLRR